MSMKMDYLLLRTVRHFLPRSMAHFFLRHNLIIRPGLETRAPVEMAHRYQMTLEQAGSSIRDQRILDFGYGGNFALACGLLQAGARQVVLIDKFAQPENRQNLGLLPAYEQFLTVQNGQVIPRPGDAGAPAKIELVEADIHDIALEGRMAPFDIVLSNSVYEHLDDVDGITRSLASLTHPTGRQVHFIDLRDHYFKYPFEMLTFSDNVWKNWLNPGSNLNRYRLDDYKQVFERYFEQVRPVVLERDPENFKRVRDRIEPKYLTGDIEIDSVTLLQIFAAAPRPKDKILSPDLLRSEL